MLNNFQLPIKTQTLHKITQISSLVALQIHKLGWLGYCRIILEYKFVILSLRRFFVLHLYFCDFSLLMTSAIFHFGEITLRHNLVAPSRVDVLGFAYSPILQGCLDIFLCQVCNICMSLPMVEMLDSCSKQQNLIMVFFKVFS